MSKDYDLAFPTVDIVLYDPRIRQILLGKKKHQDGWRMIGGFFDVRVDKSLEDAALRELREEAGRFTIEKLQYLFSSIVDDPRYKERKDKIVTSVFFAEFVAGIDIPGDDVDQVGWFREDDLPKIVDEHSYFLDKVFDHIFCNY